MVNVKGSVVFLFWKGYILWLPMITNAIANWKNGPNFFSSLGDTSLKYYLVYFYTPWKHQKPSSFLTFSGGIEMECYLNVGLLENWISFTWQQCGQDLYALDILHRKELICSRGGLQKFYTANIQNNSYILEMNRTFLW